MAFAFLASSLLLKPTFSFITEPWELEKILLAVGTTNGLSFEIRSN